MITKGYVKELWQLYINDFFTSFYFAKAIIALFFLSKDLTLAQIGLTSTLIYAANLLFEYPSGIFADKYGRKLSMQISNIGIIVTMLLFAFASGFWMIALGSLIWGFSWAFASGSKEALVYDSLKKLKKEKLNKDVLGFMDSIGFAGMIVATFIGQLFYNLNPKYPFLASAIMYFIAILLFSTYKEPKKVKSAETFDIKEAFKEGISLIFRNKTLLYVFLFASSLFFFEHAWYELSQPLLLEAGLLNSLLSSYFAIASVIGLIGGILLPKIVSKLKTKKSIVLIILLQAVGLLFLSTKNIWFVVPFSYFLLISHILWNYVDADIIHKHIPSRIRATAMSGRQLMLSFVFLFNPWLMAYLVQTFKWPVFFYSGIIVFVLGMIIFVLGKKYLK